MIMQKKIKTALASFGMSGQVFHGPLLKVNTGFEVIRILERTKNLSRKLFPGAALVRSYEELLNDQETELIVVNTPDSLHYEMARQALEAGKHVVLEKPYFFFGLTSCIAAR
jgi:scyllo-inositol 2-dehydrogenase (NADP+)